MGQKTISLSFWPLNMTTAQVQICIGTKCQLVVKVGGQNRILDHSLQFIIQNQQFFMLKKSNNIQNLSGLLTAKYQYQTLGQLSHGKKKYICQLNYATKFYEKNQFWWVPPMNETIADIQVRTQTKMDQSVNKKGQFPIIHPAPPPLNRIDIFNRVF